jgi:hypothetical protein
VTGKRTVIQERSGEVQPSRWQRRLGSRQEVADYLGVPMKTLVQWGYKSVGPPYKIIGRHARYDWEHVYRWVDEQRTGGGDPPSAA